MSGKIKSHSGAAKRFFLKSSGKIKKGSAFRSHILTKMSTKRKRGLRSSSYLSPANTKVIQKIL